MCTGAEIAMIGMAAAGSGMQYLNQQGIKKDQDRVLNAERARQANLDNQAHQVVAQTAEEFAPQQRVENQSAITEDLTENYLQPIAAEGIAEHASGGTTAGKVSNDYLVSLADGQARSMDRTAKIAKLMAKIDGASNLGREEAYGLGKLGSELGLLGRESGGSRQVANVELNNASQGNPLLGLAGGVAGGVARSGVSFGGGAGTAATNYKGIDPYAGYNYKPPALTKIQPFK